MVTPSTSLGSMSLVNCRRWKPQATARAIYWPSVFFPTPVTSSIIKVPRASRHTNESRTTSGFPRIADCTALSRSPNLESNCGAKGTGGTSMVSRCGIQRYCNAARSEQWWGRRPGQTPGLRTGLRGPRWTARADVLLKAPARGRAFATKNCMAAGDQPLYIGFVSDFIEESEPALLILGDEGGFLWLANIIESRWAGRFSLMFPRVTLANIDLHLGYSESHAGLKRGNLRGGAGRTTTIHQTWQAGTQPPT